MAHITTLTKAYDAIHGGQANTYSYSGSFETFKESEVKVKHDGTLLTYNSSPSNNTQYSVNLTNKTITLGGSISSGTLSIYPQTDLGDPTLKAPYTAGSAITASDLTNNQKQTMRKLMEHGETKLDNTGGTMTGDLTIGEDKTIIFEGATDDGYETTLTVTDPTADRTVTLPNATDTLVGKATTDTLTNKTVALGSNTVSGTLAQFNTAVTDATLVSTTGSETLTNKTLTSPVLNSTISGTSIKDEDNMASNSASHLATQQSIKAYTDSGSQTLTNKTISADNNTLSGIAASSFVVSNSSGNIDGSASQKAIPSGTVVGTSDSQTLTNKSIDSDNNTITNIVNGDIKSSAAIEFTKLENLDSTKILVGNSSNKAAEVTVSGDITIANNGVVTIANDAVGADQLDSNAVVNDSVASGAGITINKLENVSSGNIIVGNGSNVPTSVAMTGDVAIAAGGATTIQDDSIEMSMIGCEQTSITNSDAHIPTSGAVVDYVTDALTSAGSFEVIADEDNFPATHPDPKASNSIAGIAGMVVSIQNAGGLQINSSGVATNARKAGSGSDDITINGFPSSMRAGVNGNATPYELTDETGLLVTTTAQTDTAYAAGAVYEFHRVFVKPADYVQLSDDINDFNSKYRVGTKTANGDSSNDDGDLFFDTGANKMYVYDGAYNSGGEWKEVTSAGDFKFLTVKDHDQSSGGSGPTFNGSNEEFDLFDGSTDASISSAAQLIVVLNGVVQKPNSGTFSGSEEGFYLNDTHGIKFCDPPPSGSTLFVTQIGSAVTLNEPADNSVSEAKIQTGAVSTAKIDDDAVTGAKLANNLDLPDNNTIRFGASNDLQIYHDSSTPQNIINSYTSNPLTIMSNGNTSIKSNNGDNMGVFKKDGAVELFYDNAKKLETAGGGVITQGYVSIQGGSNGQLYVEDNGKVNLGTSQDLQIYHNGTNTYIDNNTGHLTIRTNVASDVGSNIYIQPHDDENGIVVIHDAGVELYYNNEKRIETSANGVIVRGPEGGAGQVFINADEGDDFADIWRLQTDTSGVFTIANGASGGYETNIECNGNGNVELYFDNSKKLETTTNGAEITGQLDITGGFVSLDDNYSVVMGTGGDAQLYHSGSHQYLLNTTGNMYFMPKAGEYAIGCYPDGKVELYYDNKLRLETHSDGCSLRSTTYSNSPAHWVEGGLKPWANDTYDLGDSSYRWRALHVNDGIYFDGNNTTATQLDDYEEGTWTPTVSYDSSDDGNKTYSSQQGTYTKVGRIVTAHFMVELSNKGTGNGAIAITLPFTVAAILGSTSLEANGVTGYFAGLSSSVSNINMCALESLARVRLYGVTNTYATSTAAIEYSTIGHSFNLRGSITYQTT